jgi:xylose isomerase
MIDGPKFGADVRMFGRFVGRCSTDGPADEMPTAIRRAGQVGAIEALDLSFPFWGEQSLETIRSALEWAGLRAAAITPDIHTHEFRLGAFTNPETAVRRRTRDLVGRAVEVAWEFGCEYVNMWPWQDGFDHPLQADHRHLWDLTVEGVRRVAEDWPSMQFALRYRPKHPRSHTVLGNAARALLAIDDVGCENVGVLMDIGLSSSCDETAADAAQLIIGRERLFGVGFADTFFDSDDGLAVGPADLLESLESLLALRRCGWDGVWRLDSSCFPGDPVKVARARVRVLRDLAGMVDQIDFGLLHAAQQQHDALAAQAIVDELMLTPVTATERVS